MKKIFCDCCGDEMDYSKIPEHLKAKEVPVDLVGIEKQLEFSVSVRIEPLNLENGQHVDVCTSCRYYLLGKLDTRPRAAS